MDNGRDTRFIFCPRCGGLMEPPVCRICGLDLRYEPGGNEASPEPGTPLDGNQGPVSPAPNVPDPNMQANQGADQQTVERQLDNIKKIEHKEKKKKFWIPLVIAAGVLLLLAICCGPVISLITIYKNNKLLAQHTSQTLSNKPSTSGKKTSEEEESEEYVGEMGKRHYGRFDHDGMDLAFYEGMADVHAVTKSGAFDPFLADNVETYNETSTVFDQTHANADPTKMGPDYYEPFCDCIDEVSYKNQYQINREYYFYDDMMGAQRIRACVAYASLSGNIPNVDKLNEEIFDRSASDLLNFLNGASPYSQYVFETITFTVDSYITYNDDKMMSILLDCVVHTDDYLMNLDSYIYAINIDLQAGKIIENDEIAKFDSSFGAKFRSQCLTQNGDNSALDPLTDKDIVNFLNDKETNIIFFSPLGLEVGMCYVYTSDILSRGWMTVTLKDLDYKTYLKNDNYTVNKIAGAGSKRPAGYSSKSNWASIDETLGKEEEKELRAAFPNYGWAEITEEEEKENSSEETSEKNSEESSEETSEDTSEMDIDDWLDYYENYDPYSSISERLTPDEYFKRYKEKPQPERSIFDEYDYENY